MKCQSIGNASLQGTQQEEKKKKDSLTAGV